ncbi:MAG: hypothetical protein Q9169_007770 [Polycauliona sp. 2 TL-2023]
MSSQDRPPGRNSNQRLPGEVRGDLYNGRSAAQRLNVHVDQNTDTSRSPQDTNYDAASLPGTTNIQDEGSPEPSSFSAADLTEAEYNQLEALRDERERAQSALDRSVRRLHSFEQRLNLRVKESRTLRPKRNFQINRRVGPCISVSESNSGIPKTTSAQGKRSIEDRDNKDENGSNQTGPRKRTANVSGSASVSNSTAQHGFPPLLGRRRHNHPSPHSTARARLSGGVSRQAYPHDSIASGTSSTTGLFELPQKTLRYDGAQTPGSPQSGSLEHNETREWVNDSTNFRQQSNDGTTDHDIAVHNQLTQSLRGSAYLPNYAPAPTSAAASPFSRKRSRDESETTDQVFGLADDASEAQLDLPLTKRQTKRQKMAALGKELPRDDEKAKGKVEQDEYGQLWTQHQGSLVKVAYHHERRQGLYARAAAQGRYTYPQMQGIREEDKTSFHRDYTNIDMKLRHGRPHLLYTWDPPENRLQDRLQMPHPGFMVDPEDNMLLIDINNHLISAWPQLPDTISSQIDGTWLEYWWRLNPNIRIEDVLARCPPMKQKTSSSLYRVLATKSAYGNARSKARLAIGTIAWEQKEGSQEIRAQLERIMPNKVLAEIAHRGTTSWFRDLTTKECDAIVHINRGKGSAPLRAGNKKLGQAEQSRRKAKKDPVAEACFHRLLQEKYVADQREPRWAQPGGPDPGFAFADPASNTTQPSTAATMGYGQPLNMHNLIPTNNDFDNDPDASTLVNDPSLLGEFGTGQDNVHHDQHGLTPSFDDLYTKELEEMTKDELDRLMAEGFSVAPKMEPSSSSSADVASQNLDFGFPQRHSLPEEQMTPMLSQAHSHTYGHPNNDPLKNEFDDQIARTQSAAALEAADPTAFLAFDEGVAGTQQYYGGEKDAYGETDEEYQNLDDIFGAP